LCDVVGSSVIPCHCTDVVMVVVVVVVVCSYNRIGNEGGAAIATALATNTTLTSLDLVCDVVVYGVWCGMCDVWCVLYAVWCCVMWCVACDVWCAVCCGVWCVCVCVCVYAT